METDLHPTKYARDFKVDVPYMGKSAVAFGKISNSFHHYIIIHHESVTNIGHNALFFIKAQMLIHINGKLVVLVYSEVNGRFTVFFGELYLLIKHSPANAKSSIFFLT